VSRLLGVLLALVCACAFPTLAAADGLHITNLQVEGGEESWHSDNAFALSWDQVPAPPTYPQAVLYRLYDSEGNLVAGPVRNTQAVLAIDLLEVPPTPGAYTVEAWLEDEEGRWGPPAYATLRFDDVPPSSPGLDAPDPGHVRVRSGQPVTGVRQGEHAMQPGHGQAYLRPAQIRPEMPC